jgi:hypothetical protein
LKNSPNALFDGDQVMRSSINHENEEIKIRSMHGGVDRLVGQPPGVAFFRFRITK